MATQYHLACSNCKEFIDLHKLRFVDNTAPLGFDGIAITQNQIENKLSELKGEIKEGNFQQWINDILPFIEAFLLRHNEHQLILIDDFGDYHWDPEQSGYCDWKETISSLVTELYLPRNLVNDLKITDWNEAKKYLLNLKVVLYEELELKEYKRKFEELVNE